MKNGKEIYGVTVRLMSGPIYIELETPEQDENKAFDQAVSMIEQELGMADVNELFLRDIK